MKKSDSNLPKVQEDLVPDSQSQTVNLVVARHLKVLVPLSPPESRHQKFGPAGTNLTGPTARDAAENLIWFPPEPVLDLARIAVDSGGDPAAIQRALDPTTIPVPDVEGSNKNRCQLTRTPYGRHFISQELNLFLKFLFELIADRGPSGGFKVSLNQFDLFHDYMFLAVDTVQEHNYLRALILQIGNTICKLPSGRLKPGENASAPAAIKQLKSAGKVENKRR
ncbi:uncharacterized protein LOC130744262 [Lotus japonicus]|uniref:uncharacterized protein LOC130744262 n=1 Tax=Lotus japonicus TaxID=34305 RepID=UPI002585C248|nr:uncharacterized protein LOC130744262 [Lotus japonicus]